MERGQEYAIPSLEEKMVRVVVDGVERFAYLRAGEDPRAAAESFCRQHNVVDGNSVNVLEKALAALVSLPPLTQSQIPERPSPHNQQHQQQQPSPHNLQHHRQQQQQEQQQQDEQTKEVAGSGRGRSTAGGAEEVRTGGEAEAETERVASVGDNVEDTARALKAVAEASYDPGNPFSILVDLVVNGNAAPLVFTPRSPHLRYGGGGDGRGDDGEGVSVGSDDSGCGDGCGGGGGGIGDTWSTQGGLEVEGITVVRTAGVVVSDARGTDGDRNEGGVGGVSRAVLAEGASGEKDGLDAEMLAAAEAWCLALGSNRPEDIAFVIAEIRTAWTAAEPRRIEMSRGEQGVIPAAKHARQQKKILPTEHATKHEETPIVTSGGDSLGVGVGVARNGEAKGAAVASQSRKRERMTVETALAPDVEAGTSLFWVQVHPTLPPLFATAGRSALELSEKWCETHNMGPSQVPLVAWKLLEVYPVQMEIARSSVKLPPARITLGYAVRQREVQTAMAVAALCWVLQKTLRRKGPTHTRKRGSGTSTSWPFRLLSSSFAVPPSRATSLSRRPDRRGAYSSLLRRLRSVGTSNTTTATGSRRSGDGGSVGVGVGVVGCGGGGVGVDGVGGVGVAGNVGGGVGGVGGSSRGGGTTTHTSAGGNSGNQDPDGGGGNCVRKAVALVVANGYRRCAALVTSAFVSRPRGPRPSKTGDVTVEVIASSPHHAADSVSDGGGCGGGIDTNRHDKKNGCRASSGSISRGGKPDTAAAAAVTSPAMTEAGTEGLMFAFGRVVGTIVRVVVEVATGRKPGLVSAAAPLEPHPTPGNVPVQIGAACSASASVPVVASTGTAHPPSALTSITTHAKTETLEAPVIAPAAAVQGEGSGPMQDVRGEEGGGGGRGGGSDGGGTKKVATVDAPRTWQTVINGVAADPNNRFSAIAVLAKAGQILGKTGDFCIETHEACDWARLLRNKKGDITVGGEKFVVLSREAGGSVIAASKALGVKIIGSSTKSGTAVLGRYSDLSKIEAREASAWLAEALTAAPVR